IFCRSLPVQMRGGAGDGDSALALQVHVVHGGAIPAAFDLLDFVDAAGVIEDALAEGRLARINVRRNAEIAYFGKVHETPESNYRATVSAALSKRDACSTF